MDLNEKQDLLGPGEAWEMDVAGCNVVICRHEDLPVAHQEQVRNIVQTAYARELFVQELYIAVLYYLALQKKKAVGYGLVNPEELIKQYSAENELGQALAFVGARKPDDYIVTARAQTDNLITATASLYPFRGIDNIPSLNYLSFDTRGLSFNQAVEIGRLASVAGTQNGIWGHDSHDRLIKASSMSVLLGIHKFVCERTDADMICGDTRGGLLKPLQRMGMPLEILDVELSPVLWDSRNRDVLSYFLPRKVLQDVGPEEVRRELGKIEDNELRMRLIDHFNLGLGLTLKDERKFDPFEYGVHFFRYNPRDRESERGIGNLERFANLAR